MSLPFRSLDAATSPGVGAARDLECTRRNHTALLTLTGNPTGFEVRLEGSLDGQIWFVLNGLGTYANTPTTVSTHYVRYVRANLVSLAGGTSPTVTVSIATGDE